MSEDRLPSEPLTTGRLQTLFPNDRLLRIGRVWILLSVLALFWGILQYFDTSTFRFILQKGSQFTPFGRDFMLFWSGARLVLEGHGSSLFDPQAFTAFYTTITHQLPTSGPNDYSYPPSFLLLTLPFGHLPYVPALFLWSAGGIVSFVLALRLLRPKCGALFLAFASPALALNLIFAQTGLYTAALFGGGLALLPTRPLLAGAFFGLLSFKPQLGLLIPLALLASKQGKAFLSAAFTTLLLFGSSLLTFGPELWSAYLTHCTYMRTHFIEQWTVASHFFVSVFKTTQLMGAPTDLSYALQGAAALCAGLGIFRLWRQRASYERRAAALLVASFFVTPYIQVYDTAVLTFAVVWMMRMETPKKDRNALFLAMALLLLVPLLSVPFTLATNFLVAPFMLGPACLILIKDREPTSVPVHAALMGNKTEKKEDPYA